MNKNLIQTHWIWDKMPDVHDLRIFAMIASLMISRKYSTSLKLFVEQTYLRSRRASCASRKTPIVKKLWIYITIWYKHTESDTKCLIFMICVFLLWELPWWSQENYQPVSDCLSSKNICDPAEHLVLVQRHQ